MSEVFCAAQKAYAPNRSKASSSPVKLPCALQSTPVWVLLHLTCAALLLAQDTAPSRTTSKVLQNDPSRAQQSFAKKCAGCHGLDGKGAERAPDIVMNPKVREFTDEELFRILQNGVPNTSMPAFDYLGDDLLHALVLHLRSLQGNRTVTPPPGNAQRGKDLFFGKGECSACHMVQGQGGFFGSDLTAYAFGRSPETIHDAIVFPNRDLDPRRRVVVATLPDGKSFEGLAQNEDNFSIQLLAPDGTLHLLAKSSLAKLTHRDESPMPADYGKRLSAAEIDDLVNFLSSTASRDSQNESDRRKRDEN